MAKLVIAIVGGFNYVKEVHSRLPLSRALPCLGVMTSN